MMTTRAWSSIVLAACLASCGGSGGRADLPDASAPGDLAEDGLGADATGDVSAAEVPSDEGGVDAPADGVDVPQACPEPPAAPAVDATRTKFALSMFHFNPQYVAGGLTTTWNGADLTLCEEMGFLEASACAGWDDAKLMDWIVDVTFAPVLDILERHPDWRLTVEVPGLMLEVMAERHADVLDRFRTLAQAGRVEVVSLHWSAQLFLAFPARDLKRSLELTRAAFDRHCIPLSGVVFNQEGQSGPGKHRFMAANGLSIDVVHVNHFGYVQWGVPLWPWYENEGVTVVVGPPGVDGNAVMDPSAGIDVAWSFFDDGEILAAPANPYFAPATPEPDATSIGIFEKRVQGLVDQGYKVATISDYANHLAARKVEKRALPAFVEGTWQPMSTSGISRWMGGRGLFAWASDERDNAIRTRNVTTGRDVAALGILVDAARKAGFDVAQAVADLESAWRHHLLSEVSDATGINPFQGELVYAREHDQAASDLAKAAIATLKASLGWKYAQIDLGAGTATGLDDIPIPEPLSQVEAPIAVVVEAPGRTATQTWYAYGPDRWRVAVAFGPTADPTKTDTADCAVSVAFPRTTDHFLYTPGLTDDAVVDQDPAAFSFHPAKDYPGGVPIVYLPLGNGLAGLGDGWWVVRDNATCMIAARFQVGADPNVLRFADETADPADAFTWEFDVLRNADAPAALAIARNMNLSPVVWK